jgi:hypothetical protein
MLSMTMAKAVTVVGVVAGVTTIAGPAGRRRGAVHELWT